MLPSYLLIGVLSTRLAQSRFTSHLVGDIVSMPSIHVIIRSHTMSCSDPEDDIFVRAARNPVDAQSLRMRTRGRQSFSQSVS